MKKYLFRIIVCFALLSFLAPVMPVEQAQASSTLTLRPSAAGDETSISGQVPNSTYHWDKMDEAIADEEATRVQNVSAYPQRDLYNLSDHTIETGVINSITIYFRIRSEYYGGSVYGRPSQKSGSTVTDGTERYGTTTWTTFSQVYPTNPATGDPYTWAEIDGLQVGLCLHGNVSYWAMATQVYVEVDYSPSVLTITTQAATVTSNTTAIGNGNIVDTGGLDVDVRGFDWDVNSGVPYSNNATDSGNFTTGAFTKVLTGLPAGTLIYYRAKAHNSAGWGYGTELTFVTSNRPTATTQSASGVSENASTLNGNITSLGGDVSCPERGFVLDTSSHGDPGNVAPASSGYATPITEAGIFGLGTFDSEQTDLIGETPYYYRSYAKNSYGYGYGNEVTFTTATGAQVLWIEWQYGTTFTDLSGNGNTATPSFRTTASNADVSGSMFSFQPVTEAEADTIDVIGALPGLLPPEPFGEGMYQEGDYSHVPGAEAVNEMLGEGGVPYSLWWFPFIYLGICIIGFMTYQATQGPMQAGATSNPFDGSLLTMAIVMEVLIVVVGIWNVVPLWPAYLFPIPALALCVSKRHFSWG